MRRRLLAASALAVPLACAASAGDLPKRKPGLWETRMETRGLLMPDMGPIQMCTDEATDDILKTSAEDARCSRSDWKKEGDRITIESVCKVGRSTVTGTAVITGSLDSSYRMENHARFDPPLHGMKEMNMVVTAEWLGSCKPGQKPGDVVMPNMGGMTINGPNRAKGAPNMQQIMKMRDKLLKDMPME